MDNKKNINVNNEYYTVDVMHILRFVWKRIWIICICAVLTAAGGFGIAKFAVTPTYSSSIMLYVNNSSISLNDVGFSISSSDISAAQSLVKTYNVLLKNRTTLERVIEETNSKYDWEELYDMIEASSVNDTEIMRITVTTTNPYHSQKIANGIAKVLPQRVTEIVEGTSMEVVDSAIVDLVKVAPNTTQYTVIGFLIGVLISIICIVIKALMDNTVHDEEYVLRTYDFPILAKVPNLIDPGATKYGYYQSKRGSK